MGTTAISAQIKQIFLYLHAKAVRRAMKAVCNIRCKGFSSLFTMLNLEMLSKASSLLQMKITESRKFLAFAKTLHDLTSLVYPVSCRNGNVTLETCYTIPIKYPFCGKRQKLPHPWSLLNLSASQ